MRRRGEERRREAQEEKGTLVRPFCLFVTQTLVRCVGVARRFYLRVVLFPSQYVALDASCSR